MRLQMKQLQIYVTRNEHTSVLATQLIGNNPLPHCPQNDSFGSEQHNNH
jgi:hypothetical protein